MRTHEQSCDRSTGGVPSKPQWKTLTYLGLPSFVWVACTPDSRSVCLVKALRASSAALRACGDWPVAAAIRQIATYTNS